MAYVFVTKLKQNIMPIVGYFELQYATANGVGIMFKSRAISKGVMSVINILKYLTRETRVELKFTRDLSHQQ